MIKNLAILLCSLVLLTAASSCKDNKANDEFANESGSYFSIRQYALDQWNTFSGEPFVILKTERVNNGRWDSSFTNSDTLNWGDIFKVFFETEISDRKFLGKYKFTQFDDDQDDTHNFFYEALEDDLYTRKLLITIDGYNQMVKGIYIEANKESLLGSKMVKLYYKPLQRIQIQTIESPLLGEKKHTVTEYDFERS